MHSEIIDMPDKNPFTARVRPRRFRSSLREVLRDPPRVEAQSELRRDGKPRPCCVYLLVHAHEPRFKIGLSISPLTRLMSLPEARSIDKKESLMLELPSERSAFRVEKTLHRALEDFRVRVFDAQCGVWPGGTEWFELDAFMHAVDILRHMPLGKTQETVRLTRLDRSAVEDDFFCWKSAVSERELRREAAARQNVMQIRKVQHLIKTLECHRFCVWRPARAPSTDPLGRALPAQTERLVIKGLSDLWEPGAIGARVAIQASDTWMFQTGKGRKEGERRSMVSLIRYNPVHPKDLELHLIDRQTIQQWPGAALMLRIWRETVGG